MSDMTKEQLKNMANAAFGVKLSDACIDSALSKTARNYEPWMDELPDQPITGLSDECTNYIRYWGSGGGRISTEECVRRAIHKAASDAPRVLADAILTALLEDSLESPLVASVLAMDVIRDSMAELGYVGGAD